MAKLVPQRCPPAALPRPYSRGFWRFVPTATAIAVLAGLLAFSFIAWVYASPVIVILTAGALVYFGALALAGYQSRSQALHNAWVLARRHLEHGEHGQVHRLLYQLSEQTWTSPHGDARVLFLRGELAMREGEFDVAEELFDAALRSGWFVADGPLADMLPSAHLSLATFEVIAREPREAIVHRRAITKLPIDEREREALLLVIDVLIAARCGDFDELLTSLERGRDDAELALAEAPAQRAVLALLEDYARAHVRGDAFREHAGEAPRWRAEELRYLGTRWPELAAFLEASQQPTLALAAPRELGEPSR
ncbi:MAG: hypothetical protein KC636_29375 [Myxococcales bacterium]|nr:hypothetical protein [Myxococcales bacterium]